MSAQKYRVFQSRLIAINDDSVFNIACHSVVVTHADYRALEEELAALRDCKCGAYHGSHHATCKAGGGNG